MSTEAHIVRLTPEEYLRAEASGEVRHEFVRGQLFDMVGGTDTTLISLNIASRLREFFRRNSQDSAWTRSIHTGEEEVSFASQEISLTLEQIYEGLDLP